MPHTLESRYSLRQRLHYNLNWNVDRVLVHFQRPVVDLEPLPPPMAMQMREIDPRSPEDARLWSHVMTLAYPSAGATPDTLQELWRSHPLLELRRGIVAYRDEEPVATILGGHYRGFPKVGGATSGAVIPAMRGQGVATWLWSYTLAQGPMWGFERAEGMALVSNVTSIRLMLRLGLRLQQDWSQVIPTYQRRRWPARQLAIRRARRICEDFCAASEEHARVT